MSRSAPRLFSIRAGVPFLPTLAEQLMNGTLVEGFSHDPADPLGLGTVTIFVPTRRAARVLRSAFVDLVGTGSAILPSIRALGETDEDGDYLDDGVEDSLELAPPVTGLERTMELAQLVLAWRNALPDHIVALYSGSPIVAPASPSDAVWLAKSLGSLIESIETEECDWETLSRLDVGDLAQWWQLTARFLMIASQYWPTRLSELDRSSPARHRAARLDRQTDRFARGLAPGPVIIAGSTGSVPATARMIATVARMERGCVVLPGLDLDMSEEDFRLASGLMTDGTLDPGPASRSHPQYGLSHLLRRLGASRKDVVELGTPADPILHRQRLMSAALLPSEATATWPEWRAAMPTEAIAAGFADVTLVEAANEREEATAIAIALKLAVSGSVKSQAALVTPDRKLARRVGLELARFGIAADDSAGTPLLSSPAGSLIHLALEVALGDAGPVGLAGLLKHPLVRIGRPEQDHLADVGMLERLVLRCGTGSLSPFALEDRLDDALARMETEKRLRIWQKSLPADAADRARDMCRRLAAALAPFGPLMDKTGPVLFADWARASGAVAEALCRDETGNLATLWSGPDGDALASLITGLTEDRSGMTADPGQWIDVMTAMMAGEGVRPGHVGHPRIFIWGTLEARLQHVDTLVLGGMNEGIWPSRTANDPFLSRTMKTAIGLEPPERRIGQNAHDFMMAASERQLLITRSMREGSAPTVASRFLQRILALTGTETADAMRARGQELLDHVEALDHAPASESPGRPAPKPAAALQPKRYSFSEVSKLRRDPYAIYAKRVLKLEPFDPFVTDPGVAERGTLYHAAVERLVAARLVAGTPASETAIAAIVAEVFAEAGLPAHVEAVWRPGLGGILKQVLALDDERKLDIADSLLEVSGVLEIVPDRLTVSGRADRIDLLKDGRADIIDYKTGTNPSAKIARSLLDPQLSLEAAVLNGGGFRSAGRRPTRNLSYVRLKSRDGFKVDTVNQSEESRNPDGTGAMDLAERAIAELSRLVAQLAEGRLGYVSRLVPAKAQDYGGEYDHLARVAEWATAEDAEGGDE